MWVQISAGLAPVECCRFVYFYTQLLKKECAQKGIEVEVLDYSKGEKKDTFKSVFLKLRGDQAIEYANENSGTMLWICKSQYRKNHKRKNWFIEVEVMDEQEPIHFDIRDINVETMRSSGNGGQNVNKLETGVRITHIPTGISVKSQEERSQHANKKLALSRLEKKLSEVEAQKEVQCGKLRWQQHGFIKRGEAVRTFKGENFKEI